MGDSTGGANVSFPGDSIGTLHNTPYIDYYFAIRKNVSRKVVFLTKGRKLPKNIKCFLAGENILSSNLSNFT